MTSKIKDTGHRLNVVFIAYEKALATSVSMPIELLRSAENIANSLFRRSQHKSRPPRLHIRIASVDGKPKRFQSGFEAQVDSSLEEVTDADIVFLPALWRNPFPVVNKNKIICKWLTKMFSRETPRIAGVGTGCCFLAEAGLLDDRVATTHWYYFEQFESRYPKVKLKRNYFITQSERIYCTGSVNTLADLTVHFIRQHYGERVSTEVERHFFHDIRQSYESLALVDETSQLHHDESVAHAQSYLRGNLQNNVNFNALADELGMSRRTFDRRFNEATGQSPLTYLQRIRMELAQELLKNSNLSISEITYQVGYQDPAHFSSLFKKIYRSTPSQYRTTVRAKLFSAD